MTNTASYATTRATPSLTSPDPSSRSVTPPASRDPWTRRDRGRARDQLPFGEDPFGETPASDFAVASTRPAEAALGAWRSEVDEARRIIANAASLDERGESGLPLRFWLVKTRNEYARHNGHADMLRELIDGTVGE